MSAFWLGLLPDLLLACALAAWLLRLARRGREDPGFTEG